jgi:multiple sugar transport system substrate-binding protein
MKKIILGFVLLWLFGMMALAQDVTIRFASWDSGTALEYQKQIAAAFEAANPGIKVQVEAYSDGFDEKIAAGFGAGDPPDLAYMWNYPDYSPNLLPLDDLLNNDAEAKAQFETYYQNLIDYNRYQGTLYGLPIGFSTHAIYYNKDLFDKAGVPYPQEGWTWEEFRASAEKLTDPANNQFGCVLESAPDPYDWQAYFWSNGGSFISEDGKEIEGILNSDANAEVLDMLGGMVKDGFCTLGGGNNQLSTSDLFATGKIALEQDGVWPMSQYQEAGINFGTIGLPSFGDAPAKNVINVAGISIAKDSKHPQEAWKFAKFFVSAEAQRMRLADLPVSPDVAQDFNGKNILEDPTMATFYNVIEQATETPAFLLTPAWSQISSNVQNAISAVMLGQATGQQALDEAVATSKRFLE